MNSWLAQRRNDYRSVGCRSEAANLLSLKDAEKRFLERGHYLEIPKDVPLEEFGPEDIRLTLAASRSAEEPAPERAPRVPDTGWLWRITPDEAMDEIERGERRTSEYSERVEWVSANLNKPTATPAKAVCNGAWAFLVWAQDHQDKFYAIERQTLQKQEVDDAEETELDKNLKEFEDLISRFKPWVQLSDKIKSGEVVLE